MTNVLVEDGKMKKTLNSQTLYRRAAKKRKFQDPIIRSMNPSPLWSLSSQALREGLQ
jgi:hypothetical protein